MATKTALEILIEVKDKATGALKGITKTIGGIAAYGVGGFAALTTGLGLVSSKLVALGSDAEEMQSKFNVVFGNLAGGVTSQLDSFGNTVGRNIYELKAMASTLGDTLQPMGFASNEAANLSVDLTKLITDLSSFNNMSMDEALQRVQGTLIGAHENALAFGAVINENTLKAEMAANGWDELSGAQLEQAKVQARINLLMAATTAAQGDAARTANSWTNQTRALKSELTEAATAAGMELLPVLTPMLQDITALARDALPQAVAIFKDFAIELGEKIGPATLLFNDALTRIGAALGITSEEVTGTDAALAGFGAVLDAIITALELAALTAQGLAWGIEQVSAAVGEAKNLFGQSADAIDDQNEALSEQAQKLTDTSQATKRDTQAKISNTYQALANARAQSALNAELVQQQSATDVAASRMQGLANAYRTNKTLVEEKRGLEGIRQEHLKRVEAEEEAARQAEKLSDSVASGLRDAASEMSSIISGVIKPTLSEVWQPPEGDAGRMDEAARRLATVSSAGFGSEWLNQLNTQFAGMSFWQPIADAMAAGDEAGLKAAADNILTNQVTQLWDKELIKQQVRQQLQQQQMREAIIQEVQQELGAEGVTASIGVIAAAAGDTSAATDQVKEGLGGVEEVAVQAGETMATALNRANQAALILEATLKRIVGITDMATDGMNNMADAAGRAGANGNNINQNAAMGGAAGGI